MAHVLLIGFMGAGKSTVGRIVAKRLGRPFVDMDRDIEWHEGRPVSRIFAEDGEVAFRDAERDAVARLGSLEPSVVACGGGVILDAENRAALRHEGTVAYLRVSAEEALSRIGRASDRPLLAGSDPDAVDALLRAREGLYEATADIVVETASREPEDVAGEVVRLLPGVAR